MVFFLDVFIERHSVFDGGVSRLMIYRVVRNLQTFHLAFLNSYSALMIKELRH